MAGYNWNAGMSNNAVGAYMQGEKPLSKWNRREILAGVAELNPPSEFLEDLKKLSISDLRNICLEETSWHHTSKFYNKTKFYMVKENLEDILDAYDYLMRQTKKLSSASELIRLVKEYGKPDEIGGVDSLILELPAEISSGGTKSIKYISLSRLGAISYENADRLPVVPKISTEDIIREARNMLKINEEKFDKYTQYINAFKVAADELSKQNVDTNDNGIEMKKDKEGKDEPELTSGQKSLVWEAQELDFDEGFIRAIADRFNALPEDVEIGSGNNIFVDGESYEITSDENRALSNAKDEVEHNFKSYIYRIVDTGIDLADFLSMYIKFPLNNYQPEIEVDSIIDDIVKLTPVKDELIFKLDYNGNTYYITKF